LGEKPREGIGVPRKIPKFKFLARKFQVRGGEPIKLYVLLRLHDCDVVLP